MVSEAAGARFAVFMLSLIITCPDETLISSTIVCSCMATKRKRQKSLMNTAPLTFGTITGMLAAAIKNHDDFILTWEPRPDEEAEVGAEREIHVMTGKLITVCRLNNLKSRVAAYEDEGAQIVSRVWE